MGTSDTAAAHKNCVLRYFPPELRPFRTAEQVLQGALFYLRANKFPREAIEALSSFRLDQTAITYTDDLDRIVCVTRSLFDQNLIPRDIFFFLIKSAVEQIVWSRAHRSEQVRAIVDVMEIIRTKSGIPSDMEWAPGCEPHDYRRLQIFLFDWAVDMVAELFQTIEIECGIFTAIRLTNAEEMGALYSQGEGKLFSTHMLTAH